MTLNVPWKLFIYFYILEIPSSLVNGAAQPHIIFIMADDLGWNDVGFHGMTDIPTPNIDAMAADSVIINNHYAGHMCSPSRAALLTGRYPSNIGMQHYVIRPGEPWGLPLELKLLPEHLNELGYSSHLVGKWHLGSFKRQYLPTYRGFQTHYGFWTGAVDYFTYDSFFFTPEFYARKPVQLATPDDVIASGTDFRDQTMPTVVKKGQYLTTLLTRRARQIIEKHDSTKPLFLYLAHHGPHRGNMYRPMRGPAKETKNFNHFENTQKKNFAGALAALDYSIGLIFESLEAKGMLLNSVLVFMSDHGAPLNLYTANGGSNWPLRGEKDTPWEGALRSVAMVWSPLLERAPRINNQLFHISDWMPTLYHLAGGDVESLGKIDGVNQWNSLLYGNLSTRNEMLLLLDPVYGVGSIRKGNFKLINGTQNIIHNFEMAQDARRSENTTLISWRTSKVFTVMQRFYDMMGRGVRSMKIPLIEIECSNSNGLIEEESYLKTGIMLFDIKNDPCETRNVAAMYPNVVEDLFSRLEFWDHESVPPNNKPFDRNSNPRYFKGFWATWKDEHVLNQVNVTNS